MMKRTGSRTLGISYDYDNYFFESPDLINSYWAGFIAADGNIYKDGDDYYTVLGVSEGPAVI